MRKDPSDHVAVLLAEFRLNGDQLETQWHEERARKSMEATGVISLDGRLYPKDGRPFFDALKPAMSRLSFFYIEDVPDDRAISTGPAE